MDRGTARPADLADVRTTNLAVVLRYVRIHAPCSRADIAASTGLNKATVTSIVTDRGPFPPDRVAASYLYYDAQADDARLTLTVARTAAELHGAVCVNHAPVVELTHQGGRATGALVEDTESGDRIEVRARVVVNAAGVWADDIRALDEGMHPHAIRPAKGIHLTVPWSLVRNDIAVIAPVPKDKRSIFVVPWPAPDGEDPAFTYIGTTDTDYDGPTEDPQCTREDVAYLLDAINHSTTTEITERHVVGTWAGLRPLVKASTSGRTADLSRNHAVVTSASGRKATARCHASSASR